MNDKKPQSTFVSLTIDASSSDTSIWLADDKGHLVQKAVGRLETSVLLGNYVVEFELGSTTYPVALDAPTTLTEKEIKAGPSCPRPRVQLSDTRTVEVSTNE